MKRESSPQKPTSTTAQAPSAESGKQQAAPSSSRSFAGGKGPGRRASDILFLQSTIGNRAVVQMLKKGGLGGGSSAEVHRAASEGVRGPSRPLPYQSQLEQSFGAQNLSGIQAYTGSEATAASLSMGAEAFTLGNKIAFARPNPSLHVVAHETAHALQQRSGVNVKGGVGETGDRYERHADAIGAAVTRGERVEPLLGRGGAGRGGGGAPSVQRYDVDDTTRAAILKRIDARGGKAASVDVEDKYYSKAKATATVAVGVASMADDPKFEAAAELFEGRIGTLAHNHSRAKAVCNKASKKLLQYVDEKHQQLDASFKDLEEDEKKVKRKEAADNELAKIGMNNEKWSGAVGKNVDAIRRVLGGGSVSEQVAHIESYVSNVLNIDLMENKVDWKTFAQNAGLNTKELDLAEGRIHGQTDKFLAYSLPKGEAAEQQWRTRARISDATKAVNVNEAPHHLSSVKPRDKDQLTKAAPMGIGLQIGAEENEFQLEKANKDPHVLKWEEGARLWALNEMDDWVAAQRALSLPLSGGRGSTTPRVMQAFGFLNVGVSQEEADDVRLAAIGALLPPRHHTLVEVMDGAQPFGASPYSEGPQMYHEIAPLTDTEVREAADQYPDEVVDPNDVRGGKSLNHTPLIQEPPLNQPEALPQQGDSLLHRIMEAEKSSKEPKAPQSNDASQGASLIAPSKDNQSSAPLLLPPSSAKSNNLLSLMSSVNLGFDSDGQAKAKPKKKRAAVQEQHPELDKLIMELREELSQAPEELAYTRGTLRNQGISNVFTDRNSAQARMLRAIDAYHASENDLDSMRSLMAVQEEAAHWLSKHADDFFKKKRAAGKRLIAKFEQVRDNAGLVMDDLEKRYLLDLAEDKLLADSAYAEIGASDVNSAKDGTLIKEHGLTMAEVAALKAYASPAYKFINPVLDKNVNDLPKRLKFFVEETETTKGNTEKAQKKVDALGDTAASTATNEAYRHAAVATRALSKLPAYTGEVYAGAALTKKQAFEKFPTGAVVKRGAFASTTRDKSVAAFSFTTPKYYDLNEEYENSNRAPDKEPFGFILKWTSRTGRNIEDLSVKPEEKEVLFAPDNQIRITVGAEAAEKDDDYEKYYVIEAEEIE